MGQNPAGGPFIDALIAAIAGDQHGYITREQLLALGLGSRAIQYRIQVGRLIPVYSGVYAVGHLPRERVAKAAAAVLACGDGAMLSYFSAAVPWKLQTRWPSQHHVIAALDRRRRGIRVHRSATLLPRDIWTFDGIRITSPARTLLDIAPRVESDDRLTRAISNSIIARHLKLDHLHELLARRPAAPGAARLLALVGAFVPTDSEFEDAFGRFCKRFDLPTPLFRVVIAGYRTDALFPVERVIVELDGYDFHSDPGAFERDRKRDTVTLAAGYQTVRITWIRLTRTPAAEAKLLHTILEARRRALRAA